MIDAKALLSAVFFPLCLALTNCGSDPKNKSQDEAKDAGRPKTLMGQEEDNATSKNPVSGESKNKSSQKNSSVKNSESDQNSTSETGNDSVDQSEKPRTASDSRRLFCIQLTEGIFYMKDYTSVDISNIRIAAQPEEYCQGEKLLDFIKKVNKTLDGKKVKVTGLLKNWTQEPLPACPDSYNPGVTPTLIDSYLPWNRAWGVASAAGTSQSDLRLAVATAKDDFSTFPSGDLPFGKNTEFTIHGTFVYKQKSPFCSDGTKVYNSGYVLLSSPER